MNALTVHNPIIWTKYLQKNYDNNAVMAKLVNMDLKAEAANYGNVIRMTKLGNVTTGSYTPGSDITISGVTSTSADLTINQMPYFAFEIDDTEEAFAKPTEHGNLFDAYSKRAMVAMGLVHDSHLLAQYANVASGNIIGTDLAPVTLTKDNIHDYFMLAGQILDEGNIPQDGRVAVVPPPLATRISQFVAARDTSLGDSAVAKNYVGHFGGFEVYKTTNLTAVSNVYNVMFFKKEDFIHHVVRFDKDRVKMFEPENRFSKALKGLMLYGTRVYNTTAGVVIKAVAG